VFFPLMPWDLKFSYEPLHKMVLVLSEPEFCFSSVAFWGENLFDVDATLESRVLYADVFCAPGVEEKEFCHLASSFFDASFEECVEALVVDFDDLPSDAGNVAFCSAHFPADAFY